MAMLMTDHEEAEAWVAKIIEVNKPKGIFGKFTSGVAWTEDGNPLVSFAATRTASLRSLLKYRQLPFHMSAKSAPGWIAKSEKGFVYAFGAARSTSVSVPSPTGFAVALVRKSKVSRFGERTPGIRTITF